MLKKELEEEIEKLKKDNRKIREDNEDLRTSNIKLVKETEIAKSEKSFSDDRIVFLRHKIGYLSGVVNGIREMLLFELHSRKDNDSNYSKEVAAKVASTIDQAGLSTDPLDDPLQNGGN